MAVQFVAIGASLLCVKSRVILNIVDRKIFSEVRPAFASSMFLYSFIPFLYSLGLTFLFTDYGVSEMVSVFLARNAILNGLASYLASCAFCYGFSKSKVRSVVVSAKLSDLVIPFVIFFSSGTLHLRGTIFSLLTVVSFFPIYVAQLRTRSFDSKTTVLIVLSLVFQAYVANLGSDKVGDVNSFLLFFTCTSAWRSIAGLGTLCFSPGSPIKSGYIGAFVTRGLLAFIAQASFLFAVTRGEGSALITWPILNSAPLLASCLAHRVLGEEMDKMEFMSGILFLGVIVGWIATY